MGHDLMGHVLVSVSSRRSQLRYVSNLREALARWRSVCALWQWGVFSFRDGVHLVSFMQGALSLV